MICLSTMEKSAGLEPFLIVIGDRFVELRGILFSTLLRARYCKMWVEISTIFSTVNNQLCPWTCLHLDIEIFAKIVIWEPLKSHSILNTWTTPLTSEWDERLFQSWEELPCLQRPHSASINIRQISECPWIFCVDFWGLSGQHHKNSKSKRAHGGFDDRFVIHTNAPLTNLADWVIVKIHYEVNWGTLRIL